MTTATPTRPVDPATPPPPTPPPPPPDRSPGAVTVGLVLVVVGTVALLATLGVDVPLAVLGPAMLVLLGIGVLVSAFRSEPPGVVLGLAVPLGVVLAVALLVGSVLDVPLRGAVGERHHVPTTAVDVEPDYRLLMGTQTLDLREVDLPAGTTEVDVSTVLGEVVVQVPEGLEVSVDADVGGGEATVFGVTQDGLAVDNDRATAGYADADTRLRLHVGVGLGEVRVTR